MDLDLLSRYLKDAQALRAWVEGFGPYGPLAFVCLQALQVVLAPLPGEVTGLAAGYLFGAFWGFIYAMVGICLGSSLAFFLARRFRNFFASRLARSSQFRRLEHFMARRGILAAFFCYLFPGFPKDYLNYFLGLFPVPFKVFFVIMTLGRAPATFALTLQGASIYEQDWLTLGLVLAVSLALGGLFYLRREELYRYLERESARLS